MTAFTENDLKRLENLIINGQNASKKFKMLVVNSNFASILYKLYSS